MLNQLMIRINPILKTSFKVLQPTIAFHFAKHQGLLDPSKHITMGKYPHNKFIDSYDLGVYPEVIFPASIAPRTYQPQVEQILFSMLNKKYNVQLSQEDVVNKKLERLFKKVLKTDDRFEDILPSLYRQLAVNIVVKESRWTWLKEQKNRLEVSSLKFSNETPETLGEFLEMYNELIEELVLISQFGTSSKIRQSDTPQQKHLLNELNEGEMGIRELEENRPQNETFINKMMKMLHSQ